MNSFSHFANHFQYKGEQFSATPYKDSTTLERLYSIKTKINKIEYPGDKSLQKGFKICNKSKTNLEHIFSVYGT